MTFELYIFYTMFSSSYFGWKVKVSEKKLKYECVLEFFLRDESEMKVCKVGWNRCENFHPTFEVKVRGIKVLHFLWPHCPCFTLILATIKYIIEDIIVK